MKSRILHKSLSFRKKHRRRNVFMNHAVKKIATGVPLSDNEQNLMDRICAKDRRRAAYLRNVVCS